MKESIIRCIYHEPYQNVTTNKEKKKTLEKLKTKINESNKIKKILSFLQQQFLFKIEYLYRKLFVTNCNGQPMKTLLADSISVDVPPRTRSADPLKNAFAVTSTIARQRNK